MRRSLVRQTFVSVALSDEKPSQAVGYAARLTDTQTQQPCLATPHLPLILLLLLSSPLAGRPTFRRRLPRPLPSARRTSSRSAEHTGASSINRGMPHSSFSLPLSRSCPPSFAQPLLRSLCLCFVALLNMLADRLSWITPHPTPPLPPPRVWTYTHTHTHPVSN